MKVSIPTLAKWSWFGVIVLVGFGYMASGLSQPQEKKRRQKAETELVSLNTRNLIPTLQEHIDAVNQARELQLAELGLRSAPAADWLTICRRMSLALVGSGMSLEEIRALEQHPPEMRESVHLQNLLDDSRFHDYWAERWTRYMVGGDGGPLLVYRRRRFVVWLSDMIAANQPYDQTVQNLITAEGLFTDQPQVNFLTVTLDSDESGNPDPIRLAARTSRAFLGMRIDCLQCHNDFLGNVNLGEPINPREGLQSDFHGLAAFYSSAKMNGLQGVRTGDADYEYQYLDATEVEAVAPAVPFQPELLPADGDVRTRLAKWVTHPLNHQFSRAAVSRFWTLMFGEAATEAVDDIPLDEELPMMLRPIVDDFRQHRDIRRVIEIIVRSDAFRVDSRADFDVTPEHEDVFAVFPLMRLRAEQVAGSIVQSSRVKSVTRDSAFLIQLMKFGSVNDFLQRYGDLGENELAADNDGGVTIPQRLLMLNGEMLGESSEPNPLLNASAHINMFSGSDSQAVDVMFLCLLNRYPDEEESAYFVGRLAEAGNREEMMVDFFWTLANTTEFAWNH
ncbi:MAG: DUF1549 domain-containing protein [Planctomycetota bacterium]